MTRRKVLRSLHQAFDYRTVVVIAGLLVFILAAYLGVAAVREADNAQKAAKSRASDAIVTRDQANRRIDGLTQQIAGMQRALDANQQANGRQSAQLAALAEQVRRMGGEPIVAFTPRPQAGTTPGPSPRPSPSRTASPRPTPKPSRHPSPSPSCVVFGLICR